jgi:hypothetical protein
VVQATHVVAEAGILYGRMLEMAIWTNMSIYAMTFLMARQKEFERDEALRTAMHVFQRQGFGATTDDLRHAIGIGRQSFYDTFKRQRGDLS